MYAALVVALRSPRVDLDLSCERSGGRRTARRSTRRPLAVAAEIREAMQSALKPEVFRKLYRTSRRRIPSGTRFPRRRRCLRLGGASTYIQEPPFSRVSAAPAPNVPIRGARPLGVFGDSVHRPHFSGRFDPEGLPAGRFPVGARRGVRGFQQLWLAPGNDQVMTRGTFRERADQESHAVGRGGHALFRPRRG